MAGLAEVKYFAPAEVDKQTARKEVQRLVEALASGLDEGTGDSLDNLINAWGERWEADAIAQYARYYGEVSTPVAAVQAEVAAAKAVHEMYEARLQEADLALAAAKERLVGQETGPPATLVPEASTGTEQERPQRFERWGGRGFADPALLIRTRGMGTLVHVIALTMAAGADLVAFLQVVQLLLNQASRPVSAMLVAGFTVMAVYLCHHAGQLLREIKAQSHAAPRWHAVACLIVWLVLGLGAAAVRYFFADPGAGQTTEIDPLHPGAAASAVPQQAGLAFVFFALYLATGLAAVVGAYFTHQPVYAAYKRAARQWDRIKVKTGEAAATLARAQACHMPYTNALAAGRQLLAAALKDRRAFTEELKQLSRYHNARLAQDPSITDGLLGDDARPYEWKDN